MGDLTASSRPAGVRARAQMAIAAVRRWLAPRGGSGSAANGVSEVRYGAAFEQVAIGLAEVALDGRMLRVNRYLCERLGYTADELRSRNVLDLTHPDDLEETRSYLREAPTWEKAYRREKRYLRKDGTCLWTQLTACVVQPPDAGPKFFIAVIEDLSERKRLEAQLLHAQKLEAVGQLAGGVAHDFSNLIGAIMGYAQLVERSLAIEDPRRADVAEIRRAGQRAASLIHQLLTFARRQETQPQLADPNLLLRNVERLVTRVLGSDVRLDWNLAAGLPAIRVDAGQFEQVILNLAINARDAMPEGGTLTVETSVVDVDRGHISRHQGARLGPHVVVTVSDTGTGMAPDVLARVFEPFFTTKGPDKGTGLGLAICYGIVKQAGGNVWVYSEPGRGTTFRLYFPAIREPVGDAPPVEADEELPRGDETILVVEDDPQMRELAARVLVDCGYAVRAVSSAEAALRDWETPRRPDLLLTDLVMPGMNGFRLARDLRARCPELPVLCMTGQSDRVARRRREEGLFPLLPKPFTALALARAVRACLDRQALPDPLIGDGL
ncbi:MAG TPA: ATP-binding protein [Gemmatimonadales bacterium]|nr:ATP-binding protein [Gemmatimonadales bacterium]